MNVFLRELRANRKALIIWSICMFLLVLSGMGKYTAYSSGSVSNDIFDKMPFGLKALFGMGSFDVSTVSGFFAFLFPYLEITVAIHAGLLGAGIIAKEELDKTTEFLMVKPLSRTSVILSKLSAALLNILVVNSVTLISSILMVSVYSKGESVTEEVVLLLVSMLAVQLIFFSVGAFFAAFLRKPKAAGSITTAILLGGFILSKMIAFNEKLNVLNVLSPFQYFSIEDVVYESALNPVILLLSCLLALGLLLSCIYFYRKRDLNI